MRRGDDADVHDPQGVVADAAELVALEHAQQLHLGRGGHVADLVEEERAAVGALDQALAVGRGAGEGPAHVAEQLALDQRLGQRAQLTATKGPAARRDCRWMERAISSLPVPLSPSSSTLLSVGATLADQPEDALHLRARAHDVAQERVPVGHARPGGAVRAGWTLA